MLVKSTAAQIAPDPATPATSNVNHPAEKTRDVRPFLSNAHGLATLSPLAKYIRMLPFDSKNALSYVRSCMRTPVSAAAVVEFARPRRVNNASLCCFPGRGYPRLSWPYELSCCCTSESPRHHHNPRPRPRFAGPKMWVAFAPHQTPRKKLPPAVGC